VRHSPGVPAPPTTGYQFFGHQLAAGALTGDGRDDLVVSDYGVDHHGGIAVLRGSAAGLTTTGAQWWDQNSPQVPESNDPGDRFGGELAVADFDADGRDDVAIGNANEWHGRLMDAGTVTVLRGAPAGLTGSGAQLWSRATAGVPRDVAERGYFGLALAAGDLNGDGRPDLAIGADAMPLDSNGVLLLGKGSVTVLYSGAGGLSAAAATVLDQASPGVPGAPEVGDRWSHDLRHLPAETGRPAVLAVSAPGERIGAENPAAGAVTVLPASPGGLTGTGSVLFRGTDVPEMAGRSFGVLLG
jgi:hypothetical protein